MNRLEVIASFDWLKEEETIGVLGYDKLPDHDVYSFEYSRQWIKDHPDIMLGKDLQPFPGKQFSQPGKGIFGCFSDSLPDHWERILKCTPKVRHKTYGVHFTILYSAVFLVLVISNTVFR